jgi:calcium-dependent protein kinase
MQFSPDQKFQQAALAYMVHHLTDMEDVKELRKMFEAFDTNKDGKLSHMEILEGFKNSLSIIQNEKEFLKVVRKIDQDRSGYIEYEEFIRATISKMTLLTDNKLQITFNLFDKDGSGSITPQELKSILGLSSKYSDKVWNEIINQIEHNKDDEVTYEEFKNMMLKMIVR